MKKTLIAASLCTFAMGFSPMSHANKTVAPSTVKQVDLKRYAGKWYEIASFPNFFQRGCQCTTATYTLEGDKIYVLNQCRRGSKDKLSKANGKAWQPDPSQPGKLKVQFFWPFSGDYWILHLDPDYQHVLVGAPKRNYLWILSRTKTMPAATYNKLVDIAKAKGFDTSKLVKTKQDCA